MPKQPELRQGHRRVEVRRLVVDGVVRGPDLPDDVLPDGQQWCERTQQWWASWQLSAQAQTFTERDWAYLLDTALLHQAMWANGACEHATELRIRLGKFGSSPEDRLRLHWKIEEEPDVRGQTRAAAG